MSLLHVGEEVSLFGLSQAEYNSKRGWIVSSLDRGRHGVWLGDPSKKPISIRSECLAAFESVPFEMFKTDISGWLDGDGSPPAGLSSAEIKRAFADNLERPLRALLGRLANPVIFPTEALQMPGFLLGRLYALIKAWSKWTMDGISRERESEYDFYGRMIDDFMRNHPGDIPVIVFQYTSLRELRKEIVKFSTNDVAGHSNVVSPNTLKCMQLSNVMRLLGDDASSFREQIGILKRLHGLYPLSAEELTSSDHRRPVGVAWVLSLDEFMPTALSDTFVETQTIVYLNMFRRRVKSNSCMSLAAKNIMTPARKDAIRELDQVNLCSFEGKRLYRDSRCALCDVSHPLQRKIEDLCSLSCRRVLLQGAPERALADSQATLPETA